MPVSIGEINFETRTIGPLVLTTPILQTLEVQRIVDAHCPMAAQGAIGHGAIAELVVQCRLSDPRALSDMQTWAEDYAIAVLYPEIETAAQLNDDRVGRMLDVLYEHRAQIWGELVTQAIQHYELDLRRLHADTMPLKFAGQFADQPADAAVARLEAGYNPQGEWVKQLKLFALAAGDGGVPVWFETLSGGSSDSPAYVPQFEALCQHADLAQYVPLHEVVVFGDRKMPTQDNQLAWARANIGSIGPVTLQAHHREMLQQLLATDRTWTTSTYVAQREQRLPPAKRTLYRYLGHTVTLRDPDTAREYAVRHVYVHSSTLARHEQLRRESEITAIVDELQRLQGLVNKYDYHTAEIIMQRVQKKAFKKRAAQRYFTCQVVTHAERPAAPLELQYIRDTIQEAADAELDGVYLLVAGGPAAQWADADIFGEWKAQYKVEHCFRRVNELFFVGPVFLKDARRISSLIFLIMVGAFVAGLLQRQVRRVLATRQTPIQGLMPEGRDTLRPSVPRLFKAFASYSVVRVTDTPGVAPVWRFAQLNAVQQQILAVLAWPTPQEIFAPRSGPEEVYPMLT